MKEKMITKKKAIKIILILLLLILCMIIFIFSNQNGEKSTGVSRTITEKITKHIPAIQNLEESQKEITLLKIEALIRKLAHFSIYTLMGILLMCIMNVFDIKLKSKIYFSIGIGLSYAILDEIHQMFIPERTARILDVGIDTARCYGRNSDCINS